MTPDEASAIALEVEAKRDQLLGIANFISAGITKLDLARFDLTESLAAVGSRRNRIDAALARSENAMFALRVELAEVEDIDIAEAIMNLQVEEVAYQATLQAMACALPPSLASFLR